MAENSFLTLSLSTGDMCELLYALGMVSGFTQASDRAFSLSVMELAHRLEKAAVPQESTTHA